MASTVSTSGATETFRYDLFFISSPRQEILRTSKIIMAPNPNAQHGQCSADFPIEPKVRSLRPGEGALKVVLIALSFFWFALGGSILSWIVCPLLYLTSFDHSVRQMRCRKCVNLSFHGFHYWMDRFDVIGYRPKAFAKRLGTLTKQPSVVIANHPTLVDVTALMAAWPALCHVTKPKLFRNPFVGPLLRMCGHLPGNESGRSIFGGTQVALDQAVARVQSGESLLIFPEGTRSSPNKMGNFHRGAFEIAIRAKVPIVAVIIRPSAPFLTKEQPWYTISETARSLDLQVLETISPNDISNRSSRKLRHEIVHRYRVALGLSTPSLDTSLDQQHGISHGSIGKRA